MRTSKGKWAGLIIAAVSACAFQAQAGDHPNLVPAVQTSTTRGGLMAALREGHVRVFGTEASKNRLAMAWGQVAFENGQGKLSYDFNLGNVASPDFSVPTYYNKGDRHYYRAFHSFADGATAYWQVIQRCSAALVRFDQGDPVSAAAALKRCRYFEAALDEYTKGFVTLYHFAQHAVFTEEEHERQEREAYYHDAFATAEFAAILATSGH